LDGQNFRGHLIYQESAAMGRHKLPGIFMVPNWMGPDTAASLKKAKEVASDDFAVFIVDMYGIDVRPTNAKEAGAAASFVRNDRTLMRARTAKAVEVFKSLAREHPIQSDNLLGIGFCFGGGTLLEYARSGADDLRGIVSFHGDLASPTLAADAANVTIPLLVLHGADDPYVPQQDVQAFIAAMQEGQVDDWTLVQFSGTVHSFTDPTADSDGARYHRRTAQRAFEMMEDFAEELL
jgi:dienelactone hydrolase